MVVRSLFVALLLLPLIAFGAPPVPVIVTTLSTEPYSESIEALGTLQSNEGITISATVTDTISAVHFEDGQRVNKGDVLLEMTSNEEHAQLEEARYVLDEAEKQYNRVKSLAKTNLATESLLDERRQAFQAAQTQLLAMQSRVADRLIIAPFSGVLGMRDISVGGLVRPGDRITTLDDDSSMKLDMTIPAVFLPSIRPGLTVTARSREIPDREFHGEITAVDSRIDPNTRAALVRARLPNSDLKLKAGMLMTIELQKPTSDSLLIPEEAVVQEGFRSFVYKIAGGTPSTVDKIEVTTGSRKQGKVVITHGLNTGDKVVTHGVMRLKQGAEVKINAEEEGDEPLQALLHPSN